MTFNELIKEFMQKVLDKDSVPDEINTWLIFANIDTDTLPEGMTGGMLYDTLKQVMIAYYKIQLKKGEQ